MAANTLTGYYYIAASGNVRNLTYSGIYGVYAPSLTVRVEKSYSGDWNAALAQFGGGNATVRVCVGTEKYDFGIGPNTLSTPGGWTGDGFATAERVFPIPPAPAVTPYTSVLTFPTILPPLEQIAGSYSKTKGPRLTVYAYQIDPASPGFTNDPLWVPNWTVTANPETGLPSVVGDLSGPIDQQLTSIFQTRVNVSQSSYSSRSVGEAVATGDLIIPEWGGIDPFEAASRINATIVITLNAQLWDGNIPIINGGWKYVPPKNTLPDDDETDTKETTKPTRDGGSSNGRGPYRPINSGPGGAGTPAYEEYIELEVTPNPINFADTDVGTQRTQPFTIRNIGTLDTNITNFDSTNVDNAFAFGLNSPNALPTVIDVGETFAGTSFFLPANVGVYNDIVYIKKGGVILKSFGITGTGTGSGNPGDSILRKIALFGDVSTSGDRNFLERTIDSTTQTTIFAVNAGSTPIVLNSVSLGGAGVFTTPGITSGFNLLPGQDIPILVNFTPVGAQEYLGTFTLNSNAQVSDQAGFNPATGAITCNLRGEGTPIQTITRILSFNVQNNGTFEDVLAGGSASAELDFTISSIGNSSVLLTALQVGTPFTLNIDGLGTYTVGLSGFYNLNEPYILGSPDDPANTLPTTTPPLKAIFTPPTATNYVDDVAVASNKTIGPESFEVRGLGLFEYPEEPEEPDVPPTPDDEPPPGQEFDPGTVPSSDLDGNGAACIAKGCEVTYIYEYSSNGDIVT